jgi:NRPS condensation-like uncharacterized protein
MPLKRNLGLWETSLSLMHDNLFATGTGIAMFGFTGQLDEEKLRQALNLVFIKHPLLRAVISHDNNAYYFELTVKFDEIPISFIYNAPDEEWKHIAEEVINSEIETQKSLWRFYAIKNKDENSCQCILNIHHAIADGMSLMKLVEDILNYYGQILSNTSFNYSVLPLLPSIEDIIKERIRLKSLQFVQDNSESIELTSIPYQKYVPIGKRKTKNIYIFLEPKKNIQINQACNTRETTVGALYNATMLITAQQMLNEEANISLITPVNLRKYCTQELGIENLGFYITCAATKHERVNSQSDVWQLANEYKKKLDVEIYKAVELTLNRQDFDLSKLTAMLDIESAAKRKHFTTGFCVTNKGKSNMPMKYSGLLLDFYYATTSRQAGDIVINLSVTSIEDKTYLCFTYAEPLVGTIWAEQFVERFLNNLISFTNIQ